MSTALQCTLMWAVLIVMVIFSAFFSSSETALSSVNRIRVKQMALEGNRQAGRVLRLSERYSRVLTGILIGNNIVNIAASTIGTVIFTLYFGPAGAGISTVVLTVIVLVFGEVMPKTIAKDHAETVSMKFSGALTGIVFLFTPFIFLFDKLKALINHFAGHDQGPSVTEQELKVIIEEIEHEGVLEKHEGELVRSALDLDETTADEVMTPRVDIVSVELHEDVQTIRETFMEVRFSRLLVYEKDIDNIVGILTEKEFFRAFLSGTDFSLSSLLKKVLFVPPQTNISDLLKKFQDKKTHLAVVIDQYGGVEGLVTLEDVFEKLAGSLYNEDREDHPDVKQLSENRWRINPDITVDEMFEEIDYHPRHWDAQSSRVGGWVLEHMEKLPRPGDQFSFEQLTVTVSEMDDRRMVYLTVEKHPDADEDQSS